MSTSRPTSPASERSTFPDPIDTIGRAGLGGQHASSVISSQMSEDGDAVGTVGGRSRPQSKTVSGTVQGATGPVGEPGLPPSRPTSMATAGSNSANKSLAQQHPPPSRRGLGQQNLGPGSAAGSRPTTGTSRTHVPSLTSHAFFRPMSSQRLQTQRGQRPPSLVGQNKAQRDGTDDDAQSRYSVGTQPTIRGKRYSDYEAHPMPPPPSQGTEFSEQPDRTTANTSPTGADTVRSRGESLVPLQQQKGTLAPIDVSKSYKGSAGALPTPQKSPRSFRSSFILPSRGSRGAVPDMRPQTGHEKLSSTASSPRLPTQEDSKQTTKMELGKNYQYFTGNTVFCWGGRLQNTRDRPINIATGIMIVLPSALFFGFS